MCMSVLGTMVYAATTVTYSSTKECCSAIIIVDFDRWEGGSKCIDRGEGIGAYASVVYRHESIQKRSSTVTGNFRFMNGELL